MEQPAAWSSSTTMPVLRRAVLAALARWRGRARPPRRTARQQTGTPAFLRVPLRRDGLPPFAPMHVAPLAARPVRAYRDPSRLVLVGDIAAVSRMLERSLADEPDEQVATF